MQNNNNYRMDTRLEEVDEKVKGKIHLNIVNQDHFEYILTYPIKFKDQVFSGIIDFKPKITIKNNYD